MPWVVIVFELCPSLWVKIAVAVMQPWFARLYNTINRIRYIDLRFDSAIFNTNYLYFFLFELKIHLFLIILFIKYLLVHFPTMYENILNNLINDFFFFTITYYISYLIEYLYIYPIFLLKFHVGNGILYKGRLVRYVISKAN